MNNRSVTAVIVTYYSEAVIGRCLESCMAAGVAEIVVVDNCSADRTAAIIARYPSVRYIANSENRGFAAAVNQGAALCRSDYLLVLNPDAALTCPIEQLSSAAEESGAACGLLVDDDGNPQRGFSIRRLPTRAALTLEVLGINRLASWNPVNRWYRCLDLELKNTSYVEQPAGAFLMFRRYVWEKLGGFDESFGPVWFEDVDLCRRMQQAGIRIRYVPTATAVHAGGHSVGRLSWEYRQVYWYVSLLRYAAKHFDRVTVRLLSAAVIVSAAPRMLTGIHRERSFKPILVFLKVVRVAGLWFASGGDFRFSRSAGRSTAHEFAKTSSTTGS